MATTGTAARAHLQVPTWQRMAIGGALAVSLAGVGFAAGRMQSSAPSGTTRVIPRPAEGVGVTVDQPRDASSALVTRHHRTKWG
jgi:hypothetical protein